VPDDNPVACCLTDAELRQREATLLARSRTVLVQPKKLLTDMLFASPATKGGWH